VLITLHTLVIRRYTLKAEDVSSRFPDQFAPFLAVPGGTGASYNATTVRLPLRTQGSAVSDRVWSIDAARACLAAFRPSAQGAFVFTTALLQVHSHIM
jgi:hypothetical protein